MVDALIDRSDEGAVDYEVLADVLERLRMTEAKERFGFLPFFLVLSD